MAWTQTDIDALKAKMAQAVKRLATGDKSVENFDFDAMERLLKLMESEVASDTVKADSSRSVLVQHGRGV